MAKIEIPGSPEELNKISKLLRENNIKHIINDDLNNQLSEEGKKAYFEFIKKPIN